ncbi:MAG: MlaD family protein [Candidatus Aenigmatarchaeota archaeon]
MKKNFPLIGRYLLEIKIGSFFLIGLILLFFSLLFIREVPIFKGFYTLKIKFNFAEGLKTSSPVRFCGVDVGEVKEVLVKEEDRPKVYVYAKVRKDILIPKNSYFFVNSLSLFGEKYLEILPNQEPLREYFKDGELVEGISPIPLFNIFMNFDSTMKELNEFVKEGKIKLTLTNTLNNIEEITYKLNDILESIKSREGTIGLLFYDNSLYKKTEEFIEEIKRNPWKLLFKPKKAK